MATLRHHIEKTRQPEDHDALLNVLAYIFTTFKAKTPGSVFEGTLLACDQHGEDKSLGPMSGPSFSTPQGYLGKQEYNLCVTLHSELQEMINRLTAYERRLDEMKIAVDSSFARLNALGQDPPVAAIDEHNKLAADAEQTSAQFAALSRDYNKEIDHYNRDCARKAVRGR